MNHFRENLDIPGVLGPKPRRGAFRLALSQMGLEKNQVAVVGDQIFTDVWGENRLGSFYHSCFAGDDKELFFTRLVEELENEC